MLLHVSVHLFLLLGSILFVHPFTVVGCFIYHIYINCLTLVFFSPLECKLHESSDILFIGGVIHIT